MHHGIGSGACEVSGARSMRINLDAYLLKKTRMNSLFITNSCNDFSISIASAFSMAKIVRA